MSVSYRPSISLKDGHLAEEQRCYDFSIYYDFDYGHNGSDNCMESNLPEDYYEDYYSEDVYKRQGYAFNALVIDNMEDPWTKITAQEKLERFCYTGEMCIRDR